MNYNLAIMRREEAQRYLCAPYDTIVACLREAETCCQVSRSLPNRQKTYNIELFWRVILGQKNLRNLRMPITCFITAESVEDRTSWRKIQHSKDREVIFKYESQMEDAFQNQALWQQQPAPCRPSSSAMLMLQGMDCSSATPWFASHGGEKKTPLNSKAKTCGEELRQDWTIFTIV